MGLQVKGLVSDRAKALVKLGGRPYLNTVSMADLFHFCQDFGRAVGCKISLDLARIQKQLDKEGLKEEDKGELVLQLERLQGKREQYRAQIEQINKTVHPFNESNELQSGEEIQKGLTRSFTAISHIADDLEIDIGLAKAAKILNQIPDIAAGVVGWQEWLRTEMGEQTLDKTPEYSQWLEKALLPYAYWQVHLTKVSGKKQDRSLRQYYSDRRTEAQLFFERQPLGMLMEENLKEASVNWAFQMAATFHRSSSQVEGRNGYLAFVHHAQRGIPEQRQKVLTVVHNFDIRRTDGFTPAQRLFKKDFPDLFEFILENVKGFPPPRTRHKKLKRSFAIVSGGQC